MEHHLSHNELRNRQAQGPPIGSDWRHRKAGGWYRVVCTGIRESDCEPVVVYNGGGVYWVRPLAEFLERFEPRAAAGQAGAGGGV